MGRRYGSLWRVHSRALLTERENVQSSTGLERAKRPSDKGEESELFKKGNRAKAIVQDYAVDGERGGLKETNHLSA